MINVSGDILGNITIKIVMGVERLLGGDFMFFYFKWVLSVTKGYSREHNNWELLWRIGYNIDMIKVTTIYNINRDLR